jgi:hypothetical protein
VIAVQPARLELARARAGVVAAVRDRLVDDDLAAVAEVDLVRVAGDPPGDDVGLHQRPRPSKSAGSSTSIQRAIA